LATALTRMSISRRMLMSLLIPQGKG